ncbi:MAG: sulfotransferase family protein [Vitreimonas sp.]
MMAYPHCWGIGLGRTGTNTLCQALTLLGYARVAHNPPFERLASLEGGADNGVLLFYKYLDYRFPRSKFVLTLRSLDTWLPSAAYASERFPLKSHDDDVPIMRRMLIYETVKFDCQKYVAAYERHHEDVRRYFKDRPSDLLEMNIVEEGDGWAKLCPFLDVPIPSLPFPRLHVREGSEENQAMFTSHG